MACAIRENYISWNRDGPAKMVKVCVVEELWCDEALTSIRMSGDAVRFAFGVALGFLF